MALGITTETGITLTSFSVHYFDPGAILPAGLRPIECPTRETSCEYCGTVVLGRCESCGAPRRKPRHRPADSEGAA